MADYLSYALRILKNVGLPCEGITTPGGFGNRALPELAQGVLEACRDVFQAEIPHYFRHLFTDQQSVAPRVEYAAGLDGPDPQCVVSMIGCTGDWFGGWDGLTPGSVDQFITADLKAGRLPEVIAGEPAILVCHWPGMYFNGQEIGFKIFQEVVRRLHDAYDHLVWMKLSQMSENRSRVIPSVGQRLPEPARAAPLPSPGRSDETIASATNAPTQSMYNARAATKSVRADFKFTTSLPSGSPGTTGWRIHWTRSVQARPSAG